MPTSLSANATAFKDVLQVIVDRLTAGPAGRIKVCAAPNERLHEYTAAEGILLRVRQPEPRAMEGAGRYGQRALRVVDIIVLTQSLKDPPDRDEQAVFAHLDKEESVINALHLIGPVGAGYNLRTGIQTKWIAGGEDIARQVKRDQGMLMSVLPFQVEYTVPLYVVRE